MYETHNQVLNKVRWAESLEIDENYVYVLFICSSKYVCNIMPAGFHRNKKTVSMNVFVKLQNVHQNVSSAYFMFCNTTSACCN